MFSNFSSLNTWFFYIESNHVLFFTPVTYPSPIKVSLTGFSLFFTPLSIISKYLEECLTHIWLFFFFASLNTILGIVNPFAYDAHRFWSPRRKKLVGTKMRVWARIVEYTLVVEESSRKHTICSEGQAGWLYYLGTKQGHYFTFRWNIHKCDSCLKRNTIS